MSEVFQHFRDWPGSASFAQIARHLLSDGLFSSDGVEATTERMPLYPLILTVVMWMTGDSWRVYAIAANAMAVIVCGGLTARLCARIYQNTLITWIGVALVSLHVAFVIEGLAFRESIWFSLVLVGLASVLTLPRIGWVQLTVAGLLTGAGYLLRPTGFVLLIVLPFWLWMIRSSLSINFSRAVSFMLFISTLGIIPWQIYAFHASGHLVLSNSEGGNNALKGAIPEFWELTPWGDYDLLDPWLVTNAKIDGDKWPDDLDKYWQTQSIAAVRASPIHWLGKGIVKGAILFSPVSIPLGYGEVVPRDQTVKFIHFRLDPWIFVSLPSVFLILCGAIFRFRFWRKVEFAERSLMVGAALLIFVLLAIHAATVSETRYRLPFDPLLAVLAAPTVASWAVSLFRRLKRSSPWRQPSQRQAPESYIEDAEQSEQAALREFLRQKNEDPKITAP
ncbi:MAG TPA: hypothetical protein VKC60_14605 [Opitutaceae bacterium]|nr:hypothetical protein [Opitutaceae bacterium]